MLSAVAGGLALVAHLAALAVNVEPRGWLSMTPSLRNALVADALLYAAFVVVAAAPVLGVAAVAADRRTRERNGGTWRRSAATAIAPALALTATSALATVAWTWDRPGAASFLMQSHLTVATVAMALAAFGAACGAWFRHPLDAAAVGMLVSVLAAGGLLTAGPAVADAPQWLIAAGLTASPLVVIASAAHIDIVRTDLLYQISPLAHRQMAYPPWLAAAAWYAAVTCTWVVALALAPRDRQRRIAA